MANVVVSSDVDSVMKAANYAAIKTLLALNNVNNTSDANKPISSATQTALDAKQATLVSGSNIKTVNGTSVLGSGNLVIDVDTSDIEADIAAQAATIAALESGLYTTQTDVADINAVVVKARDFGVVSSLDPNAATDMRTQLQAALDFCQSTNTSGSLTKTYKLILDQGTIKISGPVYVRAGVRVVGDGIGAKIMPTAGFTGEALCIVQHGTDDFCQDVIFEDLAFSGNVLAITDTYLSYTSVSGTEINDTITITGHQFTNGTKVWIKPGTLTGGNGLVTNTPYYVRDVSGNTFKLAATLGGIALTFSTDISAATIETYPKTNLRFRFHNLFFETTDCIVLRNYTQAATFSHIYSGGAVNRILHFSGNWNVVWRINKEGVTGSSTEPYVKLGPIYDGNRSTGNIFDGMNIEGLGHANKTPMYFEKCDLLELRGMWCELQGTPGTITSGQVIHFKDCYNWSIVGNAPSFQIGLPDSKIKMENSQNGYIQNLYLDPTADNIYDVLDMDSTSQILIGTLISRGNDSALRCNKFNIRVLRVFSKNNNASPNTLQFSETLYMGNNLLENGSFENLLRGWTIQTGGTPTATLVDSGIGSGKALQVAISPANTLFYVHQAVTFVADQLNKPYTFTGAVKTSAPNGCYIAPIILGPAWNHVGIVNFAREGDWTIVTQTFIPTVAGSYSIGVQCGNVTTVWLDDFTLTPGIIGRLAPNSFRDLEVGGRSITQGNAPPTSGQGTWRVGDRRYNSEPAADEYSGWVCTVAGDPGTWVPFGRLSSVKEIYGTPAGKQIELNATGDPYLKIWNEGTNLGWQLFHFGGINYIDTDSYQERDRQTGDIWDTWSAAAGRQICTTSSQKLGFYGATPVTRPTAVADATDAASVITQLNALLSRMRTLGLIAT